MNIEICDIINIDPGYDSQIQLFFFFLILLYLYVRDKWFCSAVIMVLAAADHWINPCLQFARLLLFKSSHIKHHSV